MKYIDLHCDTAGRMLYENGGLKSNSFKIDIEKMKKGGALAQVFAFFIDIGEVKNPFLEFQIMHRNLEKELDKNKKDITLVRNVEELSKAEKDKKIGAFLSIEEGETLEGNIDNIQKVYDYGVRFITLTWNYKNSLGYPNYEFLYKDKGLTPKGIEMVEECKKPFIVTHSNSRSIKRHPRNLTDDMIKKLSEKGGIMGINFCADFVGYEKVTQIKDLVSHIKHIKNVGGIDVISLGSDFDGIGNEVEVKDASEMGKLAQALEKEGFTIDEIEKIYYKNALSFLIDTLK